MERRLAAILAADVVGYARLMGQDEARTLERLKSLRKELVQPEIAARKGRIVKLMGDGLLAEFLSVVGAVHCALDMQRTIMDCEDDLPDPDRIRLRIGINLGDIIVEGNDIYGDGVNVAARLEGLANPGGICISGGAFDAIDGKIDAAMEDIGPQVVKNIAKPVRAYRLGVECARQVAQSQGEADLKPPDKPSIAVLPFENISGEPAQEPFADGLTEEIITMLSKISKLFVIARNSTLVYKGRGVDVRQVGREQGVQFVLEGSVRSGGGERLRVTAQLIEATDRALALDPENAGFLAIRSLLMTTLRKFDEALALAETAMRTAHSEANAIATAGLTLGACGKAEMAIQQTRLAMRYCPRYPLWYLVSLAYCYWILEREEEAIAACRAAIAADPDVDLPHIVLAMVHAEAGRAADARQAVEAVLRIDPDFSARTYMRGLP